MPLIYIYVCLLYFYLYNHYTYHNDNNPPLYIHYYTPYKYYTFHSDISQLPAHQNINDILHNNILRILCFLYYYHIPYYRIGLKLVVSCYTNYKLFQQSHTCLSYDQIFQNHDKVYIQILYHNILPRFYIQKYNAHNS